MSDDAKPRTGTLWLALSLAVVILTPCLYTASVGPVIRWGDRPALEPVWRVVYAPLEWAHEHTFLHDPLEWYVGFWMDLLPGRGD